jgi:putative tryptophan/tyrosine transport system substrate-binding protein
MEKESQAAQEASAVTPPKIEDTNVSSSVDFKKKHNTFLILGILVIILVLGLIGYFLFGETINEKLKPQKVYKVGILSGVENFAPTTDGFKSEMTKLGYVEGKNIIYDVRKLNDNPVQEKAISEEFVANKVDMIFAFPTEAAISAKKAVQGSNIPVVFAWSTTENTELIGSIIQPGKNTTGIRNNSTDHLVKTYNILLEMAPDTKKIWVFYDPKIPAAMDTIKIIRPISQKAGIKLVEEAEIQNIDDLKLILKKRALLSNIGIDAIMLLPEATAISPEGVALISEFAKSHKLPLAGLTSEQVGLGILFGFGPTVPSVSKLAAFQADKVLKGAAAGELPVVTVDGSLWIDYRVAQAIGLKIPEGLLIRADKIIR